MTAAVTSLAAIVALLNSGFDLVERIAGGGRESGPAVDVDVGPNGVRPVDPSTLEPWSQKRAECDPDFEAQLIRPANRAEKKQLTDGSIAAPLGTQSEWFTNWALRGAYQVPADEFDFDRYVAEGAIKVFDQHRVDVLLANSGKNDLVITQITAVAIDRGRPYSGTLVRAGGDPVSQRFMTFDLDKPEPVAMVPNKNCERRSQFFDRYKLVVGPGQAEVLGAQLTQSGCHCSFRFRIDYWQDGEFSSTTVPAEDEASLSVMGISPTGYEVVYVDRSQFVGAGDPIERYDCRATPAKC